MKTQSQTNNLMGARCLSLVLVVALLAVAGSTAASACHWVHDNQQDLQSREDWMSQLDDNLRISELSIPGTHETQSRFWGWEYYCQSLTLGQQLRAGIRAVDIRCRIQNERFQIHHNNKQMWAWFGAEAGDYGQESIVDTVIQFLIDNPSEALIMRVCHQGNTNPPTDKQFWQIFREYLEEDSCVIQDSVFWYKDFFWQDTAWSYEDSTPRLGDVRGKIYVIQEFESPEDTVFGPHWPTSGINCSYLYTPLITVQDCYEVLWWNPDFNRKFRCIAKVIDSARVASPDRLFINFTSGGMGPILYPHDLAKGIWTPFVPYWPIFGGRYSQGMNERTYLRLKSYLNSNDLARVGIIMMDYPGAGLIDVIIAQNGLQSYCLNDPPVADAGGPYEAVEGSEIVLDASGSFDLDSDPLQYRWHLWDFAMTADSTLDTTRIWDAADWSDIPTVSYTFFDNVSCYAVLEVREVPPAIVVMDIDSVLVTNAPPVASIDSLVSLIEGCILPGHEVSFYGSFVDPGAYDTHSAQWDFGDGTIEPGTLVVENDIPDATGTSFIAHTFTDAGTFDVVFEVTDDDEGVGQSVHQLRVLTPSEVVDFLDSVIQSFPDSYFRGQATQRKGAFSNKCHALKNMMGASDNTEGVINKLTNDLRSKADGSIDGVSNNDWIIEDEAQELVCLIIDELIIYIESPPASKDGGQDVTISSIIHLVDFMFNYESAPHSVQAVDYDGSGEIDISDLIYLVDYMFNQGPPPVRQ